MANLSAFTMDSAAINSGEWVTVGAEENQFEIRTRGFTQKYRDGLNRLRLHAARELNRKLRPGDVFFTPDTLTPSVDDKCQGQALAEYCVLDVRGLYNGKDEAGQPIPVTGDEFRELLREPEGRQGLLILAIGAAARIGADRAAEREVAEGN